MGYVIKSFLIKDTKWLLYYVTERHEVRPNKPTKYYIEETHEYLPNLPKNSIALASPEGITVQYDILIKKPKWVKY